MVWFQVQFVKKIPTSEFFNKTCNLVNWPIRKTHKCCFFPKLYDATD